MNIRPAICVSVGLLAAATGWTASGCTSTYILEFRKAETHDPIGATKASFHSLPRIYSFLDVRHYSRDSGKPLIREGLTDAQGRIVFKVPKDVTICNVSLDDAWFIREPDGEWKPMLSHQEYDRKFTAPTDPTLANRPEARLGCSSVP